MKRILLTCTLFISLSSIFGQTDNEILLNAKSFITNRKYDSAFKLLNEADPKNEKPDFVLLKEEIAINYFVKSIMHQMFGLKDLAVDEDIYQLRDQEGISNIYSFPVDEVLLKLIKKYPENYKLYKGLADYYYEVHLKYGDNWLKSNDELIELIEKNYSFALSNNEFDFLTYYVLGYIALLKEDYKASIPNFLASIKLNDLYPTSYYNLAYAYLSLNDRDNALQNAMKSLDLYSDQTYKGDAARMIATIYSEQGNESKMIEYYELSNEIDPNNYYTLRPLLSYYVKNGTDNLIQATTTFYELAPDNPTIYNDLFEIYYEYDKPDQLVEFFKSQLDKFKSDPLVYGNLNLYLGRIARESDKTIASEYLIKARESFSKVLDPNHQVFKIIDEALKELK